MSSERVNIWYHTDHHDQCKGVRGCQGRKKITSLGLSLEAKLVSTNDRPSIFSILVGLFPSGGEKQNAPHFARSGWTYSKACPYNFREKNRRSNLPCLCSNIKHIRAKKMDPTLEPSHFKEITYPTHFYARKSKCPRRLVAIDPEFLHVFYMPILRPDLWGGGGFFFISPTKNGLKRSTFSEKS